MVVQRDSIKFFRYAADIFVVITSFAVILFFLPHDDFNIFAQKEKYLIPSTLIFWYLFANLNGLYSDHRSRNFTYEIIGILKTVFFLTISFIVLIFLLNEAFFTRGLVTAFSILLTLHMIAQRFSLRVMLSYLRKKGRNIRSLLIVGAGEVGKDFYDTLTYNPQFGYKLVGFLDDQSKTFLNGKYLGKIDDLDSVLFRNQIDDVIIALPNYAVEKMDHVIKICEQHTTLVKIIPDYFRFASGKFEVTMFDRFPIISVKNDAINHLHSRLIKRIFDTGFSLGLFIFVFSWLWPLLAIIIKLSSPGPVFFVQERWGKGNQKIKCLKFRSMRCDSTDVNEKGEYLQASPNDERITKFGRFLRKSSLDELPQFWNVLTGELSIVGPRPHPTPLNVASRTRISGYMQRTRVKPGITGWAQVNGYRGETKDPRAMQKRVEHDLWYIENWSFSLDLQIVLLTIWNMIKGDKNAY